MRLLDAPQSARCSERGDSEHFRKMSLSTILLVCPGANRNRPVSLRHRRADARPPHRAARHGTICRRHH